MNLNTRIPKEDGITSGGFVATYVDGTVKGDPGAWELRDKSGAVIDWEVGPRDRALAYRLIDRNRKCGGWS